MAGDMREIITLGDRASTETLEHELYIGLIVTDEDVKKRAGELGISLTIRDDKRKVTQRDGILMGEVSETEGGVTRKRRLYATAGEYALAEITDADLRLSGKGTASNFIVLGNQVTKQIAHTCIQEHWKKRRHTRCHQDHHALHGKSIEGDRVCEQDAQPDPYPKKHQSFQCDRTGLPGVEESSHTRSCFFV